MKQYWKEILIAILIGLLIWTNSQTKVRTIGSTDTICHIDTIYIEKKAPTLVRYDRILVHKIDTVEIVRVDTVDVFILDTSWLYADIPVQDYSQLITLEKSLGHDKNPYVGFAKVRTIGWLDSISVEIISPADEPVNNRKIYPSLWAEMTTTWPSMPGTNPEIAPGIMVQFKKWSAGYNRSIRGTHLIRVGRKIL